MAAYQTTWGNGPIGPGWLVLFPPVAIVQAAMGGGGYRGQRDVSLPGHVIQQKKKREPPVNETLALLMLLQHR